jgi:hypothetical protein
MAARLDRREQIALKICRRRPIDPEMSARSERTTSGSALSPGVGIRRAARLALVILVGLLVTSAVVRGDIGLAGAGGLAGTVIGLAALWQVRVRHVGIRIEPQGILAVYAVGHLRFPLESVSGFSLCSENSRDGAGRVVIELLGGGRRVMPLASVVGWSPFRTGGRRSADGPPQDVVTQLAGQLQRARQQAAAALTDATPRK